MEGANFKQTKGRWPHVPPIGLRRRRRGSVLSCWLCSPLVFVFVYWFKSLKFSTDGNIWRDMLLTAPVAESSSIYFLTLTDTHFSDGNIELNSRHIQSSTGFTSLTMAFWRTHNKLSFNSKMKSIGSELNHLRGFKDESTCIRRSLGPSITFVSSKLVYLFTPVTE